MKHISVLFYHKFMKKNRGFSKFFDFFQKNTVCGCWVREAAAGKFLQKNIAREKE